MNRLILVSFLILAGSSCDPASTAPARGDYQDLNADQIMFDVKHVQMSGGLRSAEGVYDTVYVFNDSSIYHLKGVHTRMFNEAGVQSATIDADSGSLNRATDAMTAFGNVVLLTQGNCRITTEELHYDPSTRRIWSDVQSRFEIAGRVTTANSFRADDQFNNFEAEGMTGAIPRGCGVS